MKRIALLLIAAAVLLTGGAGAYNPYAPNPFDAMEQNSWEYQYVYDLTKDGLTDADLSKFSPSYPLTRFEMVPMVEAALRNRNQATEEQQKKIDRLAEAFADELALAGVYPSQLAPSTGGQPFEWKKEDVQ